MYSVKFDGLFVFFASYMEDKYYVRKHFMKGVFIFVCIDFCTLLHLFIKRTCSHKVFFSVLTEITSHVTTSFSLFNWEMFLWMYKKTLIWGERLILHFKLLFCRVIECIHLVSAIIYSSSFFFNKKLDIFPQQTL